MDFGLCGQANKELTIIHSIFKHFLKRILFTYFQREGKGGREGGKHQCVVASHAPPPEDLDCNPGMCPNWESNQRPFGSEAVTQCTEPHQLGKFFFFSCYPKLLCYIMSFQIIFEKGISYSSFQSPLFKKNITVFSILYSLYCSD